MNMPRSHEVTEFPAPTGPGAAAGLQVAGKALDVGAACLEQAQPLLVAPVRILAQVQLVRFTGQAAMDPVRPCHRGPRRVPSRGGCVRAAAPGAVRTDPSWWACQRELTLPRRHRNQCPPAAGAVV